MSVWRFTGSAATIFRDRQPSNKEEGCSALDKAVAGSDAQYLRLDGTRQHNRSGSVPVQRVDATANHPPVSEFQLRFAKRLRLRSAKPLFTGSSPVPESIFSRGSAGVSSTQSTVSLTSLLTMLKSCRGFRPDLHFSGGNTVP